MAVDKNKVIAEATKFAQRSQWDRAIKAYERILAEDPKDVRVLLKVGELHQKRGDDGAAAATFNRVAEAYTDQGFFLKAIAVYKQMIKLAPEDVRVNERLASLYQQLGIMSDAMSQLQLVAQAAERAGDQPKLLDVLRRMTELEPENVGSAVKLGEVYARQGQSAPALEEFRRAAEQLKKNNRADEYLRVAERISFLAPGDLELIRELANIYLARGDTKRALAKLQLCFKSDPKDIDTLNLLAQAFRDLGQGSKTVSVFKELAHVYAEKGRAEDARATWRRVLELAPDDAEAQAAARPAAVPPPPPPAPARAPPAGPPPGARAALVPPLPAAPGPDRAPAARAVGPEAIPKLLTETDVYVKYGLHQKALDHLRRVFEIDGDHLEAREKARDIRLAAGDLAGAAADAARAVRLCLSRGLDQRARVAVARLREVDPGHAELAELEGLSGVLPPPDLVEEEVLVEPPLVLEPAEEILVEVEHAAEEDDVALAAASDDGGEVVEDDDIVATTAEDDGPVVDDEPLGPASARLAARPTPAPLPVPAELRPTPAPMPPPPEVRRTPAPMPMPAELRPTPAPMPPPPEVRRTPAPLPMPAELRPTPAPMPPPPEVRRTPAPMPMPAELRPTPAPMPPPPEVRRTPAPLPMPAELRPTPAPMPPPPEVRRTPAPMPMPAGLRPTPAPMPPPEVRRTPAPMPLPAELPAPPSEPASAEEHLDLSDEMGEADFFIQQGLLDEARETLENLRTFYPGHPEVASRLAELDRRAAAPAVPLVADGAFDIGKELAAELGSGALPPPEEFQYSVAEVFTQFKKGVAQTVKAEDTDTHYDLGIAYKEMGLLDDALQEFETALQGATRRKEVDCLSMIALCRTEKGDAAGAAQAWRRALRSDHLTPDAARAIHYELATAYRAQGDAESALWYLNKVVRADRTFRDAAAQLAALGGGAGRPPPEPADQASRGGPKKNIGYV